MIKILHTADWHIGPRKGPSIDGKNLREEDTYRCIENLVATAEAESPDMILISGDIFDVATVGQARSHNEVLKIRDYIRELEANTMANIVVMRGTPNHDSAEAFDELKAHFDTYESVSVITEPTLLTYSGLKLQVAVVPGFDRGVYRASHPGLSKEEENQAFTDEVAKIVLGLKAQCNPDFHTVLMAHITVPGCNMEAGQNTFLQNFEPVLTTKTLNAAGYDLVCLGHIHRPQQLPNCDNVFYSGGINAFNFNDEGQERGFWVHEITDGPLYSEFHQTPYRHFQTIYLTDSDIAALNGGGNATAVEAKWRGSIDGKIVRVLYTCTEEHNKGFDLGSLERLLYADGAFYVQEITPQIITEVADRTDMGELDPEANLRQYLKVHGHSDEDIEKLVAKARPIITSAITGSSKTAYTGSLVPVEIEVHNYRNYKDEKFSFEDVRFCTINGVNGAGKSSLFMDAILDCLWEEPREGDLTGWIRNDEEARSGSIVFTFRIGEHTFRVSRSRAKSGKATLNIAELVDGQWKNRSKEKMKDTQQEINNVLGMDSMTFKSCALIMQDQYGLFLQAPKDQRMQVLGKLLGLGIYDIMEDQARDTAKIYGAKMRDRKAQIEITQQQIDSYGNPEAEIEQFEATEKEFQSDIETQQKSLDYFNSMLTKESAARDEALRLVTDLHKLTQQKDDLYSQLSEKQADLLKYEQLLTSEDAIHRAAEAYRSLIERRPDVAADAARYDSLVAQSSNAVLRAGSLNESLVAKQTEVSRLQDQLSTLDSDVDAEALKAKDQEYETARNELADIQEKKTRYLEIQAQINAVERETSEGDLKYRSTYTALNSRLSDLTHRSRLLRDSQCVDIEHANCVFLKDAKAAEGQIPEIQTQINALAREDEARRAQIKQKQDSLVAKLVTIGYDAEKHDAAIKKVAGLEEAHRKAQQLASAEASRSALKARIESDEEIIAERRKELQEARQEVLDINAQSAPLKDKGTELLQIDRQISEVKPQADKEQMIPVWKERSKTARERITEIEARLPELEKEIGEKDAKVQQLYKETADLEMLQANARQTKTKLEHLQNQLASVQREIGALEQKEEQITKLEASIAADRAAVNDLAAETADYDTLKDAFGQDGIPHQIVRSVIPKLASTATTILGQMTGGRMGIEFRTETTLKSNKNKEVVTLDILITEYGKTTLPYLSKSGGEKVKASLSVILALAEIKSDTAGMQFGMLFIDEPPFLDADGVQAYCDALVTIQSRYPTMKIMAVTHDPTMKARFPQSITVTKDEQGSHVTWD